MSDPQATERAKEITLLLHAEGLRMRRRAARIVGDAGAPDVVQDLFTRLWERAREHVVLSPAYLGRALRNVAIDKLRHEKLHRALPERLVEAQYAPPVPNPEQILIAKQDLGRIDAVLRAMPERRRHIFLLNRNLGCSYAEIAAAMDLSYSTVEREIARALTECREALEPEV